MRINFFTALLVITNALDYCYASKEAIFTYVLIHGAWGNAEDWNTVKEQLQQDPTTLQLVTPSLNPKHFEEPSLETLTNSLVAQVNNIGDSKIILVCVGYSGLIVSQVAERIPKKIRTIVYIGALLPQKGDTFYSLVESDPAGLVIGHTSVKGGQQMTISPTGIPLLLKGCQFATIHAAISKITTEFLPIKMLGEPVVVGKNFDRVEKVYLSTRSDDSISIYLQQRMIENTKSIRKVIHLPEAGPSPHICQPELIARELLRIAKREYEKTKDEL